MAKRKRSVKKTNLVKDITNIFKKQNPLIHVALVVIVVLVLKAILEALHLDFWNKMHNMEGMENKKEMVLLHWKDCGHCKKMMPEWDKFQSKNKTNVNVRKVEKDEDPALMKKHKVQGYPTILLLDEKGNKVKSYDGDRTAAAFEKFAKDNE